MALRAGPPRAPDVGGGGGPCGEGARPHCSVGASGEPGRCRVAGAAAPGSGRGHASGAASSRQAPARSGGRAHPRGCRSLWAAGDTVRPCPAPGGRRPQRPLGNPSRPLLSGRKPGHLPGGGSRCCPHPPPPSALQQAPQRGQSACPELPGVPTRTNSRAAHTPGDPALLLHRAGGPGARPPIGCSQPPGGFWVPVLSSRRCSHPPAAALHRRLQPPHIQVLS